MHSPGLWSNGLRPHNRSVSEIRTSRVVQWLRIHLATQGDVDSTPSQGTKIPQAVQHGQKQNELTFLKRGYQAVLYF